MKKTKQTRQNKTQKNKLKTDREKTKPTNNDRYNILTLPPSFAL